MNCINSSLKNESNEYGKYQYNLRIENLFSDIIKSVDNNLITFISSKTGSGKSTQVPLYLYYYLKNNKQKNSFCIICTEPRTIACNSISNYIKKFNPNINISTQVNNYFDINVPTVLFLKESELLFLLKLDPNLKNCDILIIDEVHERTKKLDLLLYYIKYFTLNKENIEKGFKLVFMSATFNTKDIYNYLSSIENQKLSFGFIDQKELNEEFKEDNYDIIYLNCVKTSLCYGNTKFNEFNMKKILREISKIVRYEVYLNDYISKTILIFLPDYKSIYSLYNILNKEYKNHINIYQFCSALSTRQQDILMEELRLNDSQLSKRYNCNVVISTTLAETCLTFPNCDVVIDCGLKKNCRYNYETNLYEELIEYISQDSCIQRSGRCGRGKKRGKCYRLFSLESFNLMEKFRKPDIETGNIDLIILKLFENEIMSKHIKEEIIKKGYLDFLSNIDKNKFTQIKEKLIKYKAIEIKNNENYEIITDFGIWVAKANMDIELGYYLDKFKNKYYEDILKEPVFQLINTISIADNYNCELFYTNIDSDWFKFKLIDNNKNTKDSKTLIDLSQNISKNIIEKALIKFNYEENIPDKWKNIGFNKGSQNIQENKEKFEVYKTMNDISPYYYLFSKLDEIYNAKNFYSKNKIFQLGDWIISLYFINQYKLMKCLKHNYIKRDYIELKNCPGCKYSKFFYCSVYSLNEKYFTKQNTQTNHIRSVLKLNFTNEEDFLVSKNEEKLIAKWNNIYLNLISSKPKEYIGKNQILKYINEFKYINFEEIMNELFEEYKKLYIDIATKYLELTKNDDEMLIQRKIFYTTEEEENYKNTSINNNKESKTNFNKISIYFNKLDKANLMKSYFFEFIPKEIDKYFCLTKFRKILGIDKNDENKIKLSKLYFRNINPIFDEMLNKSFKLKNHFEQLKKEMIDKKEIKCFNNIGKYFYYHFVAPKLTEKNIQICQNSLVYLYNKIDRDYNKEEKILELINNEKENYYNMIDSIQGLKGGCITIQLTQGLSVRNIYDTFYKGNANKNKLLYIIKYNGDYDYDESKDNNYYKQKILENTELKYENLIILKDNLIIAFKDTLQFSLFSQKQNLNLKLIPYKENIIIKSEENEKNSLINLKTYIVKFEIGFSINNIHKIMQNYRKRINGKYDCKLTYIIDEKSDSNSKNVFYFINSNSPINISEKEIIGEECKNNIYKIFTIDWLTLTSDYEYIIKFEEYCHSNNLNIRRKKLEINKDKPIQNYNFAREYELINYSIENMKLIQNYIGVTTITLNSFALLELKSSSKDTFLEYGENIYSYARNRFCNISIIYYENKIRIYGKPKYREELYQILLNYFRKLQDEKIIFNIKGKEDNLLLKTLLRKANQKQIALLVTKNDQGTTQLEFRKKNFDFIEELLLKQKKSKSSNIIKSTRCEICLEKFDNEYNNNYFKLKLCGHKFCLECLKMQICNSLNLTSVNCIPIKCIKCKTIIANSDIFEIIIPNTPEYEFLMNRLITIFMLKNSSKLNFDSQNKYYWCPNKKASCNYIYNSQLKEIGETVLTCPNCSCKICLLCNNILDPYNPHNPDCQKKLYSELSDKDRTWLLKNSKDCPMCHALYEKDKGCNHMTCTKCQPSTHFCYICGNILNSKNPLSHFSDKGSKCYNRLWDNEIKEDVNENEESKIDEPHNIIIEEDSKLIEQNEKNKNNSRAKKADFSQIMLEKINYSNSYTQNYSNNKIYYKENNKNKNKYYK